MNGNRSSDDMRPEAAAVGTAGWIKDSKAGLCSPFLNRFSGYCPWHGNSVRL
ncbi:MAG TPA: hypothetical protein VFG12_02625 [Rhodopila sp.]|nr:hypothetical protein [Rhodopila sp.]